MNINAKKPNFFIVGAPKCGTTAMHDYLNQHPDIFMPVEKEPSYFYMDAPGPQYQRYRGDLNRYLDLFAEATTQTCLGEATPGYLYSDQTACEIYEFNPSAKIIIMLREPVDMLNSTYHHRHYMGDESAPTFEEAIRREMNNPDLLRRPISEVYLPRISYTAGVKRYQEIFGHDQVHVIIFDDFRSSLAETYRKTLAFLEVDPTFRPNFAIINSSKEMRQTPFHRLLRQMKLRPSDLRDSRAFHLLTDRMPRPLYRSLIKAGTAVYARPQAKVKVSPEFRQELHDYFRDEIHNLSALLGRDLSHWLE